MRGDDGELRLLTLDLATVVGWASGPIGAHPAFGSFRVSGSDLGRWLKFFRAALSGLIVEYRPTLIIFEAPIIVAGGSALATVRKLTGLAALTELAACDFGIPVREAGASEIAKALLGRARFPGGRKEKKAATVAACKALGFAVRDDNEADAVALWLYAAGMLDAGRVPRFAGPLLGAAP